MPLNPYDPHGDKPKQGYDETANTPSRAEVAEGFENVQEQINELALKIVELNQRLVALEARPDPTQPNQ